MWRGWLGGFGTGQAWWWGVREERGSDELGLDAEADLGHEILGFLL